MKNHTIKMLMIDGRSLTADLDRAGYREMGASVSQVSSLEGAKKKLNAGAIDIVVLNYDDTAIDASQICKHIKGHEQFAKIPIIATTVQSGPHLREKALSDGVDLVVEQPIPRQVFIEQIKQLLDQSTRANKRVVPNLSAARLQIEGKSFDMPIVDISKSGVLLASNEVFKQDSKVSLEIRLPKSKKPIVIQGSIVRIEKNPHKESGIGIKFETFKTEDGEAELLGFLTKASLEVDTLRFYM